MSDHLTDLQIQRFVLGELPSAEMKAVIRHLLRGCEACEERLGPFLDLSLEPEKAGAGLPPVDEDAYDGVIERAMDAVLRRLPELEEERRRMERGRTLLPTSARLASLSEADAESLRGEPLVGALLDLSFQERYRDPEEMFRLALLARTAAESLDPDLYGPALVADLQARAWAELGNAHRVLDELDEAEAALDVAEERLRRGTGDLLLLARAADLRATLLNTRRRFSEACELLDAVHRIYLELGDPHLAGRALVSKGIYTNYQGAPQEALGILRSGLALLDPDRDPQLFASATQSLLWILVDCGEFREAGTLLLESGLRQDLAGDPLNLVKIRWLEGKVLAGTGHRGHAERAFQEARSGFLGFGQEYNAALVGLDLAEVWLEQGKAKQVQDLAEEMLATFRALRIHREAVRALDYLNRACHQQRATPATVRHVSRFLVRLEQEPQLRFQMP